MKVTLRHFAASQILSCILIGTLSCGFLLHVALANALDIHHIFADVDHDGHEHSDFDLCQWVQQHTCGSLVIDPPVLGSQINGTFIPVLFRLNIFSSQIVRTGDSRAPPLFSL